MPNYIEKSIYCPICEELMCHEQWDDEDPIESEMCVICQKLVCKNCMEYTLENTPICKHCIDEAD